MAFDTMLYITAAMAFTDPFQSRHIGAPLRAAPQRGSTAWSNCATSSFTVTQDPLEAAVSSRMGVQQHAAARTLHDATPGADKSFVNNGFACDVEASSRTAADAAAHTHVAFFNRTHAPSLAPPPAWRGAKPGLYALS